MGYVFYDVETTGLDRAFDQIIQFAAIKTDNNLRETDRFEIKSRLLPYVIPSPKALHVTGISLTQLTNPQLPSHYQMVLKIREKLSEWTPSIFIGHNSSSFDEIFIRQALYQTLHNPYLMSLNGNCRSDSLKIIQAAAIFAPNSLNFPTEDDKKIFRLTDLAKANGIDNINSHCAISDAEATLKLCQLLAENAEDVWSTFTRFSKKSTIIDFFKNETIISLSWFHKGHPYSVFVTPIGENSENPNEYVMFDLSIDPEKVAKLDDRQLYNYLESPEAPIHKVRANANPIVFPEYEAFELVEKMGVSISTLEDRSNRLKDDTKLMERMVEAYFSNQQPFEKSPYVEKQIYDEFISREDEKLTDQFHSNHWGIKRDILKSFKDKRLKALGERLVYIENPESLAEAEQKRQATAIANKIFSNDVTVPWMTIPKALREAEILIDDSDFEMDNICELIAYLKSKQHSASLV